ncbi:MAG: putative Ig domain-containing protein [Steroidobacteraceae bacterium]
MRFASFARSAALCALVATPLCLSSAVLAATSSNVPVISGAPARAVTLPNFYQFQPRATEAVISRIKFDIRNKPAWAQFDATTGRLWGRPNNANVGTYSNIVILAINWYGSAALPPFSITVSKPGTVANTRPTISGHPAVSINAGSAYRFTPTASDAERSALTFSIQGKPAWATFSPSSGTLSGTPQAADVGTYAKIVISVSDGKTSTSLPAFNVSVNQASTGNQVSTGNAMLDWIPPTQNSDGTVLTDLAGYRVHYGTSPEQMTQSVSIANPGLTSYVVDNLSAGTWYFAVTSYTAGGKESNLSGVVSTKIL